MECDKKILNRLKRSEGQMRGILKMMEDGKECKEIIVQLSAVRSSIDKVMGLMVAENLIQSIEYENGTNPEKDEAVRKAVELIVKTM
ncbi:metal-sensitive transcriptional regulator [Carnobacterium maltaromaticum]|uniref:metal-sensitive transcriptional regulator n=1 Tax=Carnobacterium maltaromaticum TaxID=2751 RepID=UPI00165A72E3|nr:metal-sensitive transcriptional regulator [Carnobacterium maltaromaticum]MBC9788514.1 metal-sensing transcriptional repressor [Carnobacterium maltaromaticum]